MTCTLSVVADNQSAYSHEAVRERVTFELEGNFWTIPEIEFQALKYVRIQFLIIFVVLNCDT